MLVDLSSCGRALVIAAVALVALSACGRRGRLEAPPDPVAVAAEQERRAERERRVAAREGRVEGAAGVPGAPVDDDEVEPDTSVVIAPAPAPVRPRATRRGPTIPTDRFILDPLL